MPIGGLGMGTIVIAVIVLMFLWSAIKILPEYERGVIYSFSESTSR